MVHFVLFEEHLMGSSGVGSPTWKNRNKRTRVDVKASCDIVSIGKLIYLITCFKHNNI